jgi:dihydrofolate reductase
MAMRKLIESTFTTLDGVIGDPQRWGPAYWDEQHFGYARELLFDAEALLLGRVTYEAFAEAWPPRPSDDYTDRINSMPKHVASRSLRETTWNASIIEGDVAKAVAELKRQPGGNLLKYGTGELDRTLLEHTLVDEYHFWIFPVLAGAGERLFAGVDTTHLQLVRQTTFRSGIIVGVYAPK